MNTFGLAPLIIILPFAGFLFNGLVGRRLIAADARVGEKWSGWFASLISLSAFAIAVALLFGLRAHGFEAVVVPMLDWIRLPASASTCPGRSRWIRCR